MRADRIAPVTWLLAAAAAWAVLGAALAWTGMGGRVAAGDASQVAAQPLPQPPTGADGGVVPVATFDAFASRPPFAQDRRPHAFVLPGGGGDSRQDVAAFDYVLSSVLITPGLRMAILEPASGGESVRVREGASAEGLGGWRLAGLRPRSAVFEGPGGRRELELRTWAGGDGGGAIPAAQPVQSPQPSQALQPSQAPQPTQVAQQMEAIRQRIEARRAQLRREAAQSQSQSQAQAPQTPATPPPGKPARNP